MTDRDALWEDPDPKTPAGRDLWDRLVNEGYSGAAFDASEARDVGQRICQVEAESSPTPAAVYDALMAHTMEWDPDGEGPMPQRCMCGRFRERAPHYAPFARHLAAEISALAEAPR